MVLHELFEMLLGIPGRIFNDDVRRQFHRMKRQGGCIVDDMDQDQFRRVCFGEGPRILYCFSRQV